jgi:DNA-binding FrmR family transcriptional regulator
MFMGHLAKDNSKLLGRVRRIKGQVEGIERALNSDKDCAEVLRQIAAVRGAINGLMAKVVEDHIDMHVAHPDITDPKERKQGAQELIDVIRTYLK